MHSVLRDILGSVILVIVILILVFVFKARKKRVYLITIVACILVFLFTLDSLTFENLFFRFDSAEAVFHYSVSDIKSIDHVIEEDDFAYFFYTTKPTSEGSGQGGEYVIKDEKGWKVSANGLYEILKEYKNIVTSKYSVNLHKIEKANKTVVYCSSHGVYIPDIIESIEDNRGSTFSSFSTDTALPSGYYITFYTVLDGTDVDDYCLTINGNERIDVNKADYYSTVSNK